jgi:3-deoxy-7-phosphoheptulonate synthase
MVDFSHANSEKQHMKQLSVGLDVATQIANGNHSIFGVMIESHLVAGNQKLVQTAEGISNLVYGQSVTDACISWEDSVVLLEQLSDAVHQRRTAK